MVTVGILTGDPELGNFVSKVGKRKSYLKNWSVRLNNAVVFYLQTQKVMKNYKYKFIKITPDMLGDELFDYIDFLFYNFMDPVAAKIIDQSVYENITRIINKFPKKVFPPPEFANLIADKCTYYEFLRKAKIPVVPFFCINKSEYMKNTHNMNENYTKVYVRNLYDKIKDLGWKGYIGKPVLGTSSRGFKLYPDFNNKNISKYEVYKQMSIHLKKVFFKYDFPKIMFQEKHAEFGEGLRPELKLYYIGTKFMFGWITFDNKYFLIGTAPTDTKFYMTKQNVTDAKRFASKVLNKIKPLFKGSPMLVTRVDIGCCLDHTNNKFNSAQYFLNEVEFGPAYILARIPGPYKMYIDHQIGNQMLKILDYRFKKPKSNSASIRNMS